MINERSVGEIERAGFSKHFVRPLYDSYCFSRIPETVERLLTHDPHLEGLPVDATGTEKYDAVILIFIDGFGWHFFEKYAHKYPFLKRFLNQGIATKITSQFPSTTAAHVTCMSTGLNVGQSGVYEWFYYEPKVDRVIAPILFSYAGDKETGTLGAAGISPDDIYPKETLYQRLHKKGITSYIVQHASIAHSAYSQAMFRGAKFLPYSTLTQALNDLVELTAQPSTTPLYAYFYFGDIDSMGHRHGIHSQKYEDAVDNLFKGLEEHFWKEAAKSKKKTACLVIADHGMVAVDPKTTCYLNKELPDLVKYFKKNKRGEPIVPAGSCRDFFLYVQDSHVLDVRQTLQHHFKERAEIYLIEELIDEKFFGNETPSHDFLKRVGNMVILPYEDEAIWWYEQHRFEQHFYGAHGGLTRKEMETIFLFNEI